MRFWWMAGVPVVIGGVVYAGGCSHKDRDFSAYGCAPDDNPCTLEDCSHLSAQPKVRPDGFVVGLAPNDECLQRVCRMQNAGVGPKDEPLTPDTICSTGVCNNAGACVDSCNDKRRNGDETGEDCGGKHCKKCVGTKCDKNQDECASGFCIDGVCCEAACYGACMNCAMPATIGECTTLEFGSDAGTCPSSQMCDGDGACKLAIGEQCTSNADCASAECLGTCGISMCNIGALCGGITCGNLKCRYKKGSSCVNHEDCASGYCDTTTKKCG